MHVAELMFTDLKTIAPGATVAEAVEILAEGHVTGLPVVDTRDRLIGVISTSDVLEAMAECDDTEARDRLLEKTAVRELMTPRPATIGVDADVKEAAQQMLYLDVHRLFVEDEGKLVGVISQTDIVRGVATAKL